MSSHRVSSETQELTYNDNCEVFHIYVSCIRRLVSNQAGSTYKHVEAPPYNHCCSVKANKY
jgi:hypothetical protein